MKLLLISDLHLCDIRVPVEMEKRRLDGLAEYIKNSGADMVLNLGDTVSKNALLRPEFASVEEGFKYYLKWRRQFSVSFAECAVDRERSFFRNVFGVETDDFRFVSPELAVLTVQPHLENDHTFDDEQLEFLMESIRSCTAKVLVIGTHVPYPGSCSRENLPGIFLNIPEKLRLLLENASGRIVWCGGHFHWKQEEPLVSGSLTALYASRFDLGRPGDDTYTRIINTDPFEITTVSHRF